MDTINKLQNFNPQYDFFVGVDSDGCAFDAMEIKHKQAFIPMAIKVWGLEDIQGAVWEVGEFVNLYSSSRGVNRFPGLLLMFEYLNQRADVEKFHKSIPDFSELKDFVNSGMSMSNASLIKFAQGRNSKFLRSLMHWSNGGDELFSMHVENLGPFDYVEKSLKKVSQFADTMIVSAASTAGLKKDWTKAGIAKYMALTAGQEIGSKKEQITYATLGRYKATHILMVGDSPGDRKAAKENGALFYPINPGDEVGSWKVFHDEAFRKFIEGSYEGEYEAGLIKKFMDLLPEKKPWKCKDRNEVK